MLANGTSAIIFPLRAKLNAFLFAQQRPRSQAWRRVVLLPVLPWVDGDRPPNLEFGRVRGSPTLNQNAWVGFGLCATGARAVRLQDFKQPVLRPSFGSRFVPDVVHALNPLPATFFTLAGFTRDSTGAILGTCVVDLFRTADDVKIDGTTSDSVGAFVVRGNRGVNHYLVAYKPGSPDVAGTTVNTLQVAG